MDNFLKVSDEVAVNLKERYKDQWVDPKDDRGTSNEWEQKKLENEWKMIDL